MATNRSIFSVHVVRCRLANVPRCLRRHCPSIMPGYEAHVFEHPRSILNNQNSLIDQSSHIGELLVGADLAVLSFTSQAPSLGIDG